MTQSDFTSPYTAIQTVAKNKLTGYLEIVDPKDSAVTWQLYLKGNRLYYGTMTVGQQDRLSCLWEQHLKLKIAPPQLNQESDYDSLCKWATSSKLPLITIKHIFQSLSQEALVQVLAFANAPVVFHPQSQFNPIIIAPLVQDLVKASVAEIRQWKQLKDHISSPLSRLSLSNQQIDEFCSYWESSNTNSQITKPIEFWLKLFQSQPSLYQTAKALTCHPLTLAQWLQPLLKDQTINLLPYQDHNQPKTQGLVACIDDSPTVQKQVRLMLELHRYQVISITEPAKSLTTLVRQKPDLILLDVNMPDMDGYTLCKMLKKSSQLSQIPIIMFTGRDGEIDRRRADLLGAQGYITKPVKPSVLLGSVRKAVLEYQEQKRSK